MFPWRMRAETLSGSLADFLLQEFKQTRRMASIKRVSEVITTSVCESLYNLDYITGSQLCYHLILVDLVMCVEIIESTLFLNYLLPKLPTAYMAEKKS